MSKIEHKDEQRKSLINFGHSIVNNNIESVRVFDDDNVILRYELDVMPNLVYQKSFRNKTPSANERLIGRLVAENKRNAFIFSIIVFVAYCESSLGKAVLGRGKTIMSLNFGV